MLEWRQISSEVGGITLAPLFQLRTNMRFTREVSRSILGLEPGLRDRCSELPPPTRRNAGILLHIAHDIFL